MIREAEKRVAQAIVRGMEDGKSYEQSVKVHFKCLAANWPRIAQAISAERVAQQFVRMVTVR